MALNSTISSGLLEMWKRPLRYVRQKVLQLLYTGEGAYCPICEKESRQFRQYGDPPRKHAQCPQCSSLERHRLLWLFFKKKTDIFQNSNKLMLHVAPELCFEPRLKKHLNEKYITADLENSRAMVKMDVTDIRYADKSFDIVCCSHVLEHVQDDKKALRELHRVLKDDGWAILLVPITADKTIEDESIISPEERARVFGQADHVRRYGPDYLDRLRNAGFFVEVSNTDDLLPPDEAVRMGVKEECGKIYYCTKSKDVVAQLNRTIERQKL